MFCFWWNLGLLWGLLIPKQLKSFALVKLRTFMWRCSKSWSCFLPSSFKHDIFPSSEDVCLPSPPVCRYPYLSESGDHTSCHGAFLHWQFAMVQLVQYYNQSKFSLRLATNWFEGPMFLPKLFLLELPEKLFLNSFSWLLQHSFQPVFAPRPRIRFNV